MEYKSKIPNGLNWRNPGFKTLGNGQDCVNGRGHIVGQPGVQFWGGLIISYCMWMVPPSVEQCIPCPLVHSVHPPWIYSVPGMVLTGGREQWRKQIGIPGLVKTKSFLIGFFFFSRQKALCQPNKVHICAEFGPLAHQLMTPPVVF